MEKQKYIKHFLIFIMMLSLSICYSQSKNKNDGIPPKPSGYGSCDDGTKHAIKDAEKKIYKSYSYGLIVRTKEEYEFNKFYQKYMKSKYGILFKDGGCVVSNETKCYSKKMRELIKKEFGSDIFERTQEEAKKEFNKTD